MAPINQNYRQRADAAIRDAIAEKECQPILFVGSGMSRRYFGAPNWHDSLRGCLSQVTDGGHEYEYYMQKFAGDPIRIGTHIAERIHEWAWRAGRNIFPAEYFQNNSSTDVFLKYMLAKQLTDITPDIDSLKGSAHWPEIQLLMAIRPHAIITTNFDDFLERVFVGYEPIVGQQVIRYNMSSFGEIFKIHGDVGDPTSVVLTQRDYDGFQIRKSPSEDIMKDYKAFSASGGWTQDGGRQARYGLGSPNPWRGDDSGSASRWCVQRSSVWAK